MLGPGPGFERFRPKTVERQNFPASSRSVVQYDGDIPGPLSGCDLNSNGCQNDWKIPSSYGGSDWFMQSEAKL